MESARETRDIAVERLGQVGLHFNMSKCRFFTFIRKPPKRMEDWWDQTERHDGLLVPGRPYCAESDEMDFHFGGMDQVLPVGETLIHGSVRYPLSRRDYGGTGTDRKAAHEKAQVVQPTGQAANVVLHRCVAVQATHFSLLCFVPEVTKRVAEAIHMRVVKAFAKIND